MIFLIPKWSDWDIMVAPFLHSLVSETLNEYPRSWSFCSEVHHFRAQNLKNLAKVVGLFFPQNETWKLSAEFSITSMKPISHSREREEGKKKQHKILILLPLSFWRMCRYQWCSSPSTNPYRVESLRVSCVWPLSMHSALMHRRTHYRTNSSSK